MLDFVQKLSKTKLALGVAGLLIMAILLGFLAGGCGNSKKTSSVSQKSTQTETANDEDTVFIRVEPGMSSSDIGKLLIDKGVIDSKISFWWNVKKAGADSKLQTGLFEFHKNMDVNDVIYNLMNGKISTVKVVIPEGFSVPQIAKRLSDSGLVDEKEFLNLAKTYAPYDYIEERKDADYRIEGFLFPATYEFGTDLTAEDIMKAMAENFDSRLTADMRARAKAQKMSIYDMVTLASMVEKEARYDEDRPIIAQVFHKRLSIDMPLQSDTTITYLIGAKDDVSIADTKVSSPYNTYQNYGLPPGPIACPGTDAMEAVLYPANTNYLYFVADRDGHNHYSTNYNEHLKYVDEVR